MKNLKIKFSKTILVLCSAIAISASSSITYAYSFDSKTFSYTNFHKIEASGAWKLKISHADKYSVKIIADKNVMDHLIIKQEGDVLKLDWKPGFSLDLGNGKVSAEVIMPQLDRIDTSGAVKLKFGGFNTSNFILQTSGASMIAGKNNQIKDLSIKASGASKINLEDNSIQNTKLDLSGATKLDLNVSGDLTGNVSGVAKVDYNGNPKKVDVHVSGLAKIEKD